MADLKLALSLLDRFEHEGISAPQEAERLLVEIFRACGFQVTDKGFVGGHGEVDCFVDTVLEGRHQRIGVDLKYGRSPLVAPEIGPALRMQSTGTFDRMMVVARAGFSASAIRLAETEGLGKVDLFSPADLRNWLAKHERSEPKEPRSAALIRCAMAAMAKLVAEHPEELAGIEWRDLERLLGVAFRGLGFEAVVTRPGKDGGFDLELTDAKSERRETYLVEVKHWHEQKPGFGHVEKLVRVAASKKATGALFLSTSGFAGTVYSGMAKISAPIRLGDGCKVVAICQAYYRLESGLWLADDDPKAELFAGTIGVGDGA